MNKIGFLVDARVMRGHDAVYLLDGNDPREELVQAVIQHLSTDVEITIGETKMHLAAWMDPDHWSDDWAKALNIPYEEVDEAVDNLLSNATEES